LPGAGWDDDAPDHAGTHRALNAPSPAVPTSDAPPWLDTLAAVVAAAPEALRALASEELHIGGFTNVQLAHPVLDLRALAGEDASARALAFFLAATLLQGATLARIHVARGADGVRLARLARRQFRAALARVDDENVALLRYFDVYLHPAAEIEAKAGVRMVRLVTAALAAD